MDQATLADAAYYLRVTQFMFACGYALVLYDGLISIRREHKLIWKLDWSLVKVLYLFCRYWPIAVIPYILVTYLQDHSLEHCQKAFRIPVALAMWNQLGAEAILLARTSAFLGNRKGIFWSLLILLLAVAGYQLYVVFSPMKLFPFLVPPFDKGPCLPTDQGLHILGFFLAPLLFDSIVTLLMIYRLTEIGKDAVQATGTPLIRFFVSEGLWYFVLVSLGNLLNGIFYFQPKKTMSAINIPFSIMLPNIIACRLILDLREHASKSQHWELSKAPTGFGGFLFPNAWIKSETAQAQVSTIRFNVSPKNMLDTLATTNSIDSPFAMIESKQGRSSVDIVPDRVGRVVPVHPSNSSEEVMNITRALDKLV